MNSLPPTGPPPEGLFRQLLNVALSLYAAFSFAACELSYPEACGLLVPLQGTEPMSPYIGRWILNHWAAREVTLTLFLSVAIPLALLPMWET